MKSKMKKGSDKKFMTALVYSLLVSALIMVTIKCSGGDAIQIIQSGVATYYANMITIGVLIK